MLLSPILKFKNSSIEKPIIAILKDNSQSQLAAFLKIDSTKYHSDINMLQKLLGDDYIIKLYSFGSQLIDSLKNNYKDNATNLSDAIAGVLDNFENQNLSTIVIATDGIINAGVNPIFETYPYKGIIYTIGVCDTTLHKDAILNNAFANKVVYLGDKFSIRNDLTILGAAGSQVTLSVLDHQSNRVVASKVIHPNSSRFSQSIETIIDANKAGLQHYTISISALDDEVNKLNNSKDIYVEVLDTKEKILIVANSPSPDIYALSDALSANKNYKVDVRTIDKVEVALASYNLIILHNLPSASNNATSIIDQAQKSGTSIWFIIGTQTAIIPFNKAQSTVTLNVNSSVTNEAFATLNTQFSFFNVDAKNNLNLFPPLSSPMGNYQLGDNTSTLFFQRISGVSTQFPLWIMKNSNAQKQAVLCGEGLWRWRLYNYKLFGNYQFVDEYILKTTQFLSVKKDERKFRTILSKPIYTESEQIQIDAELHNENYELINTPDVTIVIEDTVKKNTVYTMNKNEQSYSLNIGNLAAGNYHYTSSVNYNGNVLQQSGNFSVISQNIENTNTTADFGMLHSLAKNYDGEFLYASELSLLAQKIKSNPKIKAIYKTDSETKPLINWKWLFGVLLFCLGLEWYFRKRNGLL